MSEQQFAVTQEYVTGQRPFRSRSFSLGSGRKQVKVNESETNQLLSVARAYNLKPVENDGNKKLFCDVFKKMPPRSSHSRTARKHREMRQTFLYGRNICRYICNVVRFIGMLIIFVAFGLHLQYQWQMGNYSIEIIILTTTAGTSFAFVIILYLFFGLKSFSRCIVHVWVSLAYGVVFLQQTHLRLLNKTIMICLIVSTGLRCCCSLVERIAKFTMHRPQFLSQTEFCDLLAFSLVCSLLPHRKALDIWLEIAALGFLVINIRMKSHVTIPLVGLYAGVSGISIVGNIGVETNKYSFICFLIRMFWDPILDLYFNKLKPLARWSSFFYLSRICLYPFLFILLTIDVIFLAAALQAIWIHPKYEWPIILPFITVSGVAWLIMHLTYFAVHVSFFQRLASCKRTVKQAKYEGKSLLQIFSKEGLKSFAGICRGVASGCVFVSGLFGAICWRRKDGTYPAMFLLILTIEFLSLTLFTHLGSHLKGTCCGYGIVASSNVPESKPGLVLPSSTHDFQTMSSTRLMNTIQGFFRDHFIESLGCDCWSGGARLSLLSVETKLGVLFSKRTPHGHPYDNYFIYYSGLADKDGSWLLADGNKLTLEHIIKIWNDRPSMGLSDRNASRLLIISDSPNSAAWCARVKRLREPVVVQTCTYACDESNKMKSTPEEGWAKRGDFTLLWTSFLSSLQSLKYFEEDTTGDKLQNFTFEARVQGILARYSYSNSFLTSYLSPSNGDFSTHGCTLCCLPVVLLTSFLSSNLFFVFSCAPLRKLWFILETKCFAKSSCDLGEGLILINL